MIIAGGSPVNLEQEPKKHTVKRGDTLYSISKKYGTSVKNLKLYNQLSSDVIQLGQVLDIPVTRGYYNPEDSAKRVSTNTFASNFLIESEINDLKLESPSWVNARMSSSKGGTSTEEDDAYFAYSEESSRPIRWRDEDDISNGNYASSYGNSGRDRDRFWDSRDRDDDRYYANSGRNTSGSSTTRPGKYNPNRPGNRPSNGENKGNDMDTGDFGKNYSNPDRPRYGQDYYSEEDIFYRLNPKTQAAIIRLDSRLGEFRKRQIRNRNNVQRNLNRRSRGIDRNYDASDRHRRSSTRARQATRSVRTYRVRSEDTLQSIARRFDNSSQELYELNRLRSRFLREGQLIKVLVWEQ
ncbi:MAG: LysM peptidoglycan-binding domain-containing protein [Bacteroidota bacterium]